MPSEDHKQKCEEMKAFEKLQLKADERLLKRIVKMMCDYDLKHDEIVSKRRDKMMEILTEYKTEEEVQEAWGYACITEAERDCAISAIRGEQAKVDQESEYSIMVKWLSIWTYRLKAEINELQYQLMTPDQQRKHDQGVENWNNKIDELRRKRDGK